MMTLVIIMLRCKSANWAVATEGVATNVSRYIEESAPGCSRLQLRLSPSNEIYEVSSYNN